MQWDPSQYKEQKEVVSKLQVEPIENVQKQIVQPSKKKNCYKMDKEGLKKFSDYSIIQLESVLNMISNLTENPTINIEIIEERIK